MNSSVPLLKQAIRPSLARHFGTEAIQRTALNAVHKQIGGKMVEFCGWELPVQYETGVLKEHLGCREGAAIFDVSHMGQLRLRGQKRVQFIEKLVVSDIAGLAPSNLKLSVMTNAQGGIIDDTMISNHGDFLYQVINAGCVTKDMAHIRSQLAEFNAKGGDVTIDWVSDTHSLIALQGPKSEGILAKLVPINLGSMNFMSSAYTKVDGIECLVSRCGYTGEDGFEIAVPHANAEALWARLSTLGALPAGLGARDSLRLEAGLCLYGNDIDETTSPVEANLVWVMGPKGSRRRTEGGFLGASVVLDQIANPAKVTRKRVGFAVSAGAPARSHTPLLDANGNKIGEITSGTFGPSSKSNVAMGYVATAFSKDGSQVNVDVRGKVRPAVVSKMPFVPHGYKR